MLNIGLNHKFIKKDFFLNLSEIVSGTYTRFMDASVLIFFFFNPYPANVENMVSS